MQVYAYHYAYTYGDHGFAGNSDRKRSALYRLLFSQKKILHGGELQGKGRTLADGFS